MSINIRSSWLSAAAVVALGALAGVLLFRDAPVAPEPAPPATAALAGITCVALDHENTLYVGGSFGVKRLDAEGREVLGWATPLAVQALAADAEGHIYAAYATRIEKFSRDGRSLLTWGRGGCDGEDFANLTGATIAGEDLFVADSGERVVYRFGLDGEPRATIAGGDETDPEPGFMVPSPYFDCAAAGGTLLIADPGRLRVDRFDFDGRLLGHWGQAGTAPAEFPGCCNPSNIALFADGRVAVAQKGEPCIKVFDASGTLLLHLGAEVFAAATRGIDLAVDPSGRIYAADPQAGCVRVFETRGREDSTS